MLSLDAVVSRRDLSVRCADMCVCMRLLWVSHFFLLSNVTFQVKQFTYEVRFFCSRCVVGVQSNLIVYIVYIFY